MCGIAGIVALHKSLSPDRLRELATKMSESIKHRGPDDWGVWLSPDGRCALSQRRLSIIDLTPAGHQPMVHPATGSAITFNGEIYNYIELRKEQEAKGHRFIGLSDTEVLLKGLIDDGTAIINKLDAMFAFGFYDNRNSSLLLARDNFGEKPLYYTKTKDYFAFASELSALTLLPDFDPTITIDALATYLSLQYLPAPQTIYSNANKLPPAHTLLLTADGDVKTARYYTFRASIEQSSNRTLDDMADELEAILIETVKARLISDVPLGAFLSGGVDSSIIVAMAQKAASKPIKTFSIGFDGSAESEHLEARQMAMHLQTDHYDKVLSLNALETGQQIASLLDEPNGDTSCLPVYLLSEITRQHVTVALSGDGGDELFGGYGRYPRTLQDAEANSGNPAWSIANNYYSPRILVFGDSAIQKFLGFIPDQTKNVLTALRAPLDDTRLPILQRLRETDIQNYMPGAVLAKVDRMSMQHALEVRAPFLGRKVADFASQMAANDLCTATDTKIVLKHLAARYIPREWLDRPKKGFGLPIQGWGGQELTQRVASLIGGDDCCLAKWIDRAARQRFLAFHQQTPITYQLWEIYILELWLRANIHRAA